MAGAATSDGVLQITINPEARVSVVRGGRIPSAICGQPLEIPIVIQNDGFVTAPLGVALVDPAGAFIGVELIGGAPSGAAQQQRMLRLIGIEKRPTDITIAFRLRKDFPDIGGRDRVHFLTWCQ